MGKIALLFFLTTAVFAGECKNILVITQEIETYQYLLTTTEDEEVRAVFQKSLEKWQKELDEFVEGK